MSIRSPSIPAATDRQILLYTRLMVVALGLLGLRRAAVSSPTILEMALWAYTMYGAAITPALLAAFLWPRVTRAGGVASILAGMLTTLGWEIYARKRRRLSVWAWRPCIPRSRYR